MGIKNWLCALLALCLLCAMIPTALAEPEGLDAPVGEQTIALGDGENESETDGLEGQVVESDPVEMSMYLDPDTCSHPNMEHHEGAFNYWDGEKYTVKSLNDREHQITGAFYTWDWCPDCGQCYNIVKGDKQTWTEHHDYDDGPGDVCMFELCGHKNTCKHKNLEHNEGVWAWEDGGYTAVSLNDREHEVTGPYYTWDWCPDCDNCFNLTLVDENRTWRQDHWYNDEGVCELGPCGHVRECKHPNPEHCEGAFNYWDGEKYTVKSVNERQHKINGAYYTWDWCPDCDECFNIVKGKKKTWTENHDYDENGVCRFEPCGHKNACKHKNVEHNEGVYYWDDGNYTVVSLNDREHEVTGPYYTWDWCRDCERDINIKMVDPNRTWTQGHWYDGGNVCQFKLCGHVNACKHPNMEHREGAYNWWNGEKYTVKVVSDAEHKITGYVYTWDCCPDCDQDFNVRRGAKKTATEPHWYDENGVCQFEPCGYVCKHKNIVEYRGVRDPEACEIECLNEREHHVAGPYYVFKGCETCGMIFEERDEGYREWDESHWFNDQGFCNLCGYECENRYALTKNGSVTMNNGDYLFLTLGGNTAESYKSSKESVVEVIDGMLYARSVGTANITVKLTNKKSLKLKVTVVDPTIPKKVTVKSPAGTTFSMAQTPTAQLEYTIEPATAADAKVTWTTSNKKYATVDENGLVTFQGKGKVTITATVIGEKNKKITGKIKLTVNK